jgi:hypothetical protein
MARKAHVKVRSQARIPAARGYGITEQEQFDDRTRTKAYRHNLRVVNGGRR